MCEFLIFLVLKPKMSWFLVILNFPRWRYANMRKMLPGELTNQRIRQQFKPLHASCVSYEMTNYSAFTGYRRINVQWLNANAREPGNLFSHGVKLLLHDRCCCSKFCLKELIQNVANKLQTIKCITSHIAQLIFLILYLSKFLLESHHFI